MMKHLHLFGRNRNAHIKNIRHHLYGRGSPAVLANYGGALKNSKRHLTSYHQKKMNNYPHHRSINFEQEDSPVHKHVVHKRKPLKLKF